MSLDNRLIAQYAKLQTSTEKKEDLEIANGYRCREGTR